MSIPSYCPICGGLGNLPCPHNTTLAGKFYDSFEGGARPIPKPGDGPTHSGLTLDIESGKWSLDV